MARNVKRINLALQGGGAHGAFTWGALDRLLDDDGIEISGITGTSAGALNGAALKAGLVGGGRDGARAALDDLWTRVGAVEDDFLSKWMAWVATGPLARSMEYSPAYFLADAWARMVSPYATGPFYANPLKPIVEAFGWSLVILDVAEDEDLYERFGMRIPVLRRSDVAEALCWPFCARDVEALAMVQHG